MKYKRLFILVEGNDDERFLHRITKERFEKKYNYVMIWKYSQIKKEKIVNFINSINSMGADYIFVRDFDDAKCITAKRKKIYDKYKSIVDFEKIMIVKMEIESWYLAGLLSDFYKKYKMPVFRTTDNITKEQFNNLIPKKFNSRIYFMLEILDNFSTELAKNKNKSFSYFIKKYDC